ncbi:GNAT family N-acetyltransferase [Nocardioides sp. CPCC 205120]|uniref:GNAT family N-acetyltransferase n=1 Tax=Nocardioides sp. CPCC 205120 TaxID=3406462 RepID=UPI003B50E978
MERLERDAHGIPHLTADSLTGLARLHGVATAQDRTWQLELLRRRATGTVAALVGPAGTAWDTLARRADLPALARRAFDDLDAPTRDFLAAYATGVTSALRDDTPELLALDAAPGPWEPWTPVAALLGHNVLFGTFPQKLWRQRVVDALGEEGARLLSAEGVATSGSNAWAVGGARTASGLPLVGGDPHRVIEAPGVYQQVRLVLDGGSDAAGFEAAGFDVAGFDVAGFAFVGVPGVQHFAHAGEVAWAITNAMADTEDLYAESLRRRGPHVEARGTDGWEPVRVRRESIEVRGGDPAEVEVVTTARGVVVHEGPAAEGDDGWTTVAATSLRTAPWVAGRCGLDALLPLLRARTVDDVDRALDAWVLPVNNVVVADARGAVRYRVAGLVPRRPDRHRRGVVPASQAGPDGGWNGWLSDLPRHDVPSGGQVVTANERRGPESEPIGASFAPPHRARRITQLLDGRTGLDADDFAAVHRDTLLLAAARTQAVLAALPEPGPAGVPVRAAVLAWDGHADAGSTGAAAFAAWRSALVRLLVAEPVFDALRDPTTYGGELAPYQSLTARLALALDTLLEADRPFGVDVAALAVRAFEDAAGHPATWGETHVLDPAHGFELLGVDLDAHPVPLVTPRVALSGDGDTVRCTGSLPGTTDASWRGSVARYVWDLADRGRGGWVVPLGASGHPGPHSHDQLDLWVRGELLPCPPDPRHPPSRGGRMTAPQPEPRPDAPSPARPVLHERRVPGLGHLTLAELDPATEAEVVHAWTREERARFWMMGDKSLEEVRDIYAWIDEQPTHAAYLVRLDGEPAALFQTYDPRAEEVGDLYDVRPGDVGVHLMTGPPTTSRPGFTLQVAALALGTCFADPAVTRVLTEPDARNAKVQARLDAMGATRGPEVRLSTKPAVLRFVDRSTYDALVAALVDARG